MLTLEELQVEIKTLKSPLAERDHRDAFASAALKAGVLPRAARTAWDVARNELGHKPGESPEKALVRLAAEHQWLFGNDHERPKLRPVEPERWMPSGPPLVIAAANGAADARPRPQRLDRRLPPKAQIEAEPEPELDLTGRCPTCRAFEVVTTPIMVYCPRCKRHRHVDAKPLLPVFINTEASRRRIEMGTLPPATRHQGLAPAV